MNQCINCKHLQRCCENNEVDSADIFRSQDICDDFETKDLPKQEVCKWVKVRGLNESSCGEGNQIDIIDYEDFKYCPYCNKPIELGDVLRLEE